MNLRHGGNIFAFAHANGCRWQDVADFSASINPLGPSPRVRPAILDALDRIVHYPEAEPSTLRHALAGHWNLDPDTLILGNGATDLIHFFARNIATTRVRLAAPVFSEFHRAFPSAEVVPFDSTSWTGPGLVVVTRPANPTGAMPALDACDTPLLVDESFLEFTGAPSLAGTRENLFVLRSLTKFHALPGLRIGALAGPAALMTQWRARREPWPVNVLAEAAVLASIADHDHAARTIAFVRREREWLTARLAEISGLHPLPSQANYMLVALDQPAAPLVENLARRRILVRDCSGWPGVGFAHAIRLAVRTREENLRLLEALCAS
ncbi:MAG: aminotransferase class I/II-fold pyridoxal phosphate-dependent enzyme [Bryobacteraceae bacterium]|nr:aminotransferase class I/II-fold pyridoxal phosphate-dependent enzyme [Bryobacteraceae bacterium]